MIPQQGFLTNQPKNFYPRPFLGEFVLELLVPELFCCTCARVFCCTDLERFGAAGMEAFALRLFFLVTSLAMAGLPLETEGRSLDTVGLPFV